VPWYSKINGFQLIRLKEVIFLKNLLVSFWWPISILAFPILYAGQKVHNYFILILIGSGLFIAILNNTLFHDIMDESGDRLAGIRTLPTIFGSKFSYLLLFILDGLWVALCICFFLLEKVDLPHTLFLGFLTLYPATYIFLYIYRTPSRISMEFWSESDLILFSLGLFFLKG
jgi:4-hydroxybenzoate polyprenyltransferase